MARAVDAVRGCEEYPHPWSQAYSVLGALTPSSRMVWPSALTKWFPETVIDKAGAAVPAGAWAHA